jgi:hypothetical protein
VAERESGSFTVVPIVAQRRIRLERQLELGRDVLGRERRHRPGKLRRNVLVLDPGTAQDPQLLVAGEPVHQRREKRFPRFGAAHADVGLCGRETLKSLGAHNNLELGLQARTGCIGEVRVGDVVTLRRAKSL